MTLLTSYMGYELLHSQFLIILGADQWIYESGERYVTLGAWPQFFLAFSLSERASSAIWGKQLLNSNR